MDLKNNIVAIILPIWLFIAKEVIPYFIKRYASKKEDGTYNQEALKDINKELFVAILRFPCDFIIIAAGYIIARIFICTEAMTRINPDATLDTIKDLTMQLNTNHTLFWLTLLFVLPLCVLWTRKCESLLYPKSNQKVQRTKAIISNILLYIVTIAFVLWLLFTN